MTKRGLDTQHNDHREPEDIEPMASAPAQIKAKDELIQPVTRISSKDLDSLMSTLEVNVIALSECLVSRGYRLDMGGAGVPRLHYNLKGGGGMFFGNSN